MPMCSDIAIYVDNVSKSYEPTNSQERSKKGWKRLFARDSQAERIQALKDVSLEVRRGETMGIVGHNGAGKSTLLRIITGITEADSGSVRVNGAIAPVLALQGGFNPQSTGRDNVYLRGAAMGLSRAEIDERFDSIGAFADIGDAMAQPLRTYSNGMRARLAFAVAFNAQPDILIVDETLTVGDEIFRRKCMDRIITIKESGATILFVTHGYNLVLQLCDRAVLLDQGERLLVSDPKTVVERFHELVYAQPEERTLVRKDIKEQDLNGIDAQLRRYDGKSVSHAGDIQKDDFSDANLISKTRRELVKQGAVIKEVRLFDCKGEAVNTLKSKADYGINVPIWLTEPANKVRVTIAIKTIEGIIVSEQVFTFCGTGDNETLRPKTQLCARFNFHNLLVDGVYAMDVLVNGEIAGKDMVLHGIIDAALIRVDARSAPQNRGMAHLIEPVVKEEPQKEVMPGRLAEVSKC